MACLLARYSVRDPELFRRIFDSFEVTRFHHGATGHRLLMADDDRFVVMIEFPNVAAARTFAHSPERLSALEDAGVRERDDAVVEDIETLRY